MGGRKRKERHGLFGILFELQGNLESMNAAFGKEEIEEVLMV